MAHTTAILAATGAAVLAISVTLALPYAPAYAGGLGLATLARIADIQTSTMENLSCNGFITKTSAGYRRNLSKTG